ncbi:MAG TPA: glutathione S-transferase N-terminal domain-containing protein [Conexibacter sp.]|nr:glutathione S-transferase N-terminal domain-containing protein [Conexibacter sp.]
MQARLYGFGISNPANSARLMLAFKGVEAQWVELLPGLHPLLLRALGFKRGTVPTMKLDGRRIEGSLEIAQTLEALVPQPSLYPADPERRRAVEEAERWGEAELQNVPRRLFRWTFAHDNGARAALARDIGVPLPGLVGWLNMPVARMLAGRVDADEAHALATLRELPATLDRVDALIADGVIGDPEAPNAADFQIAPSIRALAGFADLLPLLAGRPCDAHARRLMPRFPEGRLSLPPRLKATAGL